MIVYNPAGGFCLTRPPGNSGTGQASPGWDLGRQRRGARVRAHGQITGARARGRERERAAARATRPPRARDLPLPAAGSARPVPSPTARRCAWRAL